LCLIANYTWPLTDWYTLDMSVRMLQRNMQQQRDVHMICLKLNTHIHCSLPI